MKLKFFFRKFFNRILNFDIILENIESLKILTAKRILQDNLNNSNNLKVRKLSDYEFKVFSQFGEDGIIQYLIKMIPEANNFFVEFGVGDYEESNTRFLMQNNNWSGLVIDSDKENIQLIKKKNYYWKHDIKAVNCFINIENINNILNKNIEIKQKVGLLSIDIDGNDYWILNAIDLEKFKPAIIICEYNSLFGFDKCITIPYSENFNRGAEGVEKIYYGASIKAITELAFKKGYYLIGSNNAGNNLFFVEEKYKDRFKILTEKEAYVRAKFRENVNLSYQDCLALLEKKIFYDVNLKKLVKFNND